MSEQNTRKTRSGGDVSEKIFNTRIVHKHDTEANWNKAINFIPKAGELIIYDPDENYVYSRIKIGDGVTIVTNLPFIKAEAIDVPEVNVDGTLSIEGAAADAKAVGDAFDALGILSTKDSVSKSDLALDVQTSLGKADTALQSYTETDPTVPAWAKASTKPSYTASEVGLGNVDNVKQYSASNPPPYPVKSVNGKTGAVTIKAVPSCSTSDNGKFLRVVNGSAAWATISNAEEAIF